MPRVAGGGRGEDDREEKEDKNQRHGIAFEKGIEFFAKKQNQILSQKSQQDKATFEKTIHSHGFLKEFYKKMFFDVKKTLRKRVPGLIKSIQSGFTLVDNTSHFSKMKSFFNKKKLHDQCKIERFNFPRHKNSGFLIKNEIVESSSAKNHNAVEDQIKKQFNKNSKTSLFLRKNKTKKRAEKLKLDNIQDASLTSAAEESNQSINFNVTSQMIDKCRCFYYQKMATDVIFNTNVVVKYCYDILMTTAGIVVPFFIMLMCNFCFVRAIKKSFAMRTLFKATTNSTANSSLANTSSVALSQKFSVRKCSLKKKKKKNTIKACFRSNYTPRGRANAKNSKVMKLVQFKRVKSKPRESEKNQKMTSQLKKDERLKEWKEVAEGSFSRASSHVTSAQQCHVSNEFKRGRMEGVDSGACQLNYESRAHKQLHRCSIESKSVDEEDTNKDSSGDRQKSDWNKIKTKKEGLLKERKSSSDENYITYTIIVLIILFIVLILPSEILNFLQVLSDI